MIPIFASCLLLGTRKFSNFVGKKKLCHTHIACWRETGKACTADCMVVIFVQLCWRVNSALYLLIFLKIVLFTTTFLANSDNILHYTDFSNIYCEPICSVPPVLLVLAILFRNLLNLAWWMDICLTILSRG